MKTVKDYLFELDTTQLVDTYFEEYGEKLYDLYYFNSPTCEDDRHIDYDESIRDIPVYDYAQAERKELYDFIKYLRDIEITGCSFGKTGIIYVFGKYDNLVEQIDDTVWGVGDDNDDFPAVRNSAQPFHEFAGNDAIQSGIRLIEDEQGRIADIFAGDGQTFPLSARKALHQ